MLKSFLFWFDSYCLKIWPNVVFASILNCPQSKFFFYKSVHFTSIRIIYYFKATNKLIKIVFVTLMFSVDIYNFYDNKRAISYTEKYFLYKFHHKKNDIYKFYQNICHFKLNHSSSEFCPQTTMTLEITVSY